MCVRKETSGRSDLLCSCMERVVTVRKVATGVALLRGDVCNSLHMRRRLLL